MYAVDLFFFITFDKVRLIVATWEAHGLRMDWPVEGHEIRVSLLDALLSYTQQLLGRHNRLVSLVANQDFFFHPMH